MQPNSPQGRWPAIAIAASPFFMLACAPGGAEPGGPHTNIGAPLDVTVDPWMGEPVVRAIASPAGGVFVEKSDGVHWLESVEAEARFAGEGALRAVAEVEGRTIVGTSAGIFTFQETFVRSPITDALEQRPPVAIVSGDSDLWISTDSSLHRWHNDQVTRIALENLALVNAELAYGAPIDDQPALWGESGGFLFSLSAENKALVHREADSFDSLAIDASGRLWATTAGTLTTRDPLDQSWHTVAELSGVSRVVADRHATGAWIITATQIYRADEQNTLRPIKTTPPAGELFSADPSGSLLIAGTTGLYRLRSGRTPEVIGLSEGSVILEPKTITIRIAQRDALTSATVTIDGAARTFDPGAPTLELDPATFTDGAHRLEITAVYSDGAEPATLAMNFATFHGRPPTWSTDITPLFDDHCAQCHAAGGVGRRLDARDHWIENIDRILAALRERRMPLPPNRPLAGPDIDTIAAWQAAGFLE